MSLPGSSPSSSSSAASRREFAHPLSTRTPTSRLLKPCCICHHATATIPQHPRGRRRSIAPPQRDHVARASYSSAPSSPNASPPSASSVPHRSSHNGAGHTICPRCHHDQDACTRTPGCRGQRAMQRFLWRCWACEAENIVEEDSTGCVGLGVNTGQGVGAGAWAAMGVGLGGIGLGYAEREREGERCRRCGYVRDVACVTRWVTMDVPEVERRRRKRRVAEVL